MGAPIGYWTWKCNIRHMSDAVLIEPKIAQQRARIARTRRQAAAHPLVQDLAARADDGQRGEVSEPLGPMSRAERHRVLFGPK